MKTIRFQLAKEVHFDWVHNFRMSICKTCETGEWIRFIMCDLQNPLQLLIRFKPPTSRFVSTDGTARDVSEILFVLDRASDESPRKCLSFFYITLRYLSGTLWNSHILTFQSDQKHIEISMCFWSLWKVKMCEFQSVPDKYLSVI